MSWIDKLKKISKENRNQLRAVLQSDTKQSIKLLNMMRDSKSFAELKLIEDTIRAYQISNDEKIPELFPKKPQTKENFYRLKKIELRKNLLLTEKHIKDNAKKIEQFFISLNDVNYLILDKKFKLAAEGLKELYEAYGYSHLLLRKVVLVKTLNRDESELKTLEALLSEFGLDRNNIIITSLIHSYKEEQDYLIIKKSVTSRPDRGAVNRFSRDMSRLSFHPFAKDEEDFTELLQSCNQSSLIDGFILLKINEQKFSSITNECIQEVKKIINNIKLVDIPIDTIVSLYDLEEEDSDHTFLKHSSAWLENKNVIKYRVLHDHFYDFPESNYLSVNDEVMNDISSWIGDVDLEKLNSSEWLSAHGNYKLQQLEKSGMITNSSLFNFCVFKTRGYTKISESGLIELMGRTRELAKTINIECLENLATVSETQLSKLILYLLIAKKSRNERLDHQLRSILQKIVVNDFNGDLIEFIDCLSKRSSAVSEYFYETATEDFIAKLYHLIQSAERITETRANLHRWMGQFTGKMHYSDRARTILIDKQINKIRNEIDDHRIYVDVARFNEWVSDEVIRDLSPLITNIGDKNELLESESPQFIGLLERCYSVFCSNNVFGIASYLGRRIRHGTFKGHLYSAVISIENQDKYHKLLNNPSIQTLWNRWKRKFEDEVDLIIAERLQVESQSKRQGLLRPYSREQVKLDIYEAGAKYIVNNFIENKSYANLPIIITEFCWRLAEIDLRVVSQYLIKQKGKLLNADILAEMKVAVMPEQKSNLIEFSRDLTHILDQNLRSISNWFKRPVSASPKVSLQLLFKAVVSEVKKTFSSFRDDFEQIQENDIELIGSVYLLIYDALYVVVYNAAKHGEQQSVISSNFLTNRDNDNKKYLIITVENDVKENDSDTFVNERLTIRPEDSLDDAQTTENRSGIRKLYHLEKMNKDFKIKKISCENRKVKVEFQVSLVA